MGNEITVDGPEWTDEAIEQEINDLKAAPTKPGTRKRKPRGPKINIEEMMSKQKIRANLDLTPYVNERLTEMINKLGLPRQALVTRYILEGLKRDAIDYGESKSEGENKSA